MRAKLSEPKFKGGPETLDCAAALLMLMILEVPQGGNVLHDGEEWEIQVTYVVDTRDRHEDQLFLEPSGGWSPVARRGASNMLD